MTPPEVTAFFDEATFTATHLVSDPATRTCAIIDPVLDYDPASGRTRTTSADALIAAVEAQDLTVAWVLETHVHADHLTAAPYLKQRVGGRIGIGDRVPQIQRKFGELFNAGPDFKCDGSQFDQLFSDGEAFRIGNIEAQVIATPGHTPACVTYVIGDAAFVGDTIFMPDFGTARCDFPGGDARNLYRSIQRILALPASTRVFTCHDYKAPGRDVFAWESTVEEQRARNIHVGGDVSEDEFVRMRTERDAQLSMPKLLFPAVQVNMRAGAFPGPEENGVSYLKIPLNAL